MQEQSKERCRPPKAEVCALTVKLLCPDHTGQLLVPRAPCELLGSSFWGREIRAPGGEKGCCPAMQDRHEQSCPCHPRCLMSKVCRHQRQPKGTLP